MEVLEVKTEQTKICVLCGRVIPLNVFEEHFEAELLTNERLFGVRL